MYDVKYVVVLVILLFYTAGLLASTLVSTARFYIQWTSVLSVHMRGTGDGVMKHIFNHCSVRFHKACTWLVLFVTLLYCIGHAYNKINIYKHYDSCTVSLYYPSFNTIYFLNWSNYYTFLKRFKIEFEQNNKKTFLLRWKKILSSCFS